MRPPIHRRKGDSLRAIEVGKLDPRVNHQRIKHQCPPQIQRGACWLARLLEGQTQIEIQSGARRSLIQLAFEQFRRPRKFPRTICVGTRFSPCGDQGN